MKYLGFTLAALGLSAAVWTASTTLAAPQEAMPPGVDSERWIALSDSAGLQLVSPEMGQLWVRANSGEWTRIELVHPVRARY